MTVRYPRLVVLDGVVVAHQPYGVRVRMPSDEIGVVDQAALADPDRWPEVGEPVRVVTIGHLMSGAGIGQLRLSTRPADIEFARANAELAVAERIWQRFLESGVDTGEQLTRFLGTRPVSILRRALRFPTVERPVAMVVLANAPDDLIGALASDLAELVDDDTHGAAARALLSR